MFLQGPGKKIQGEFFFEGPAIIFKGFIHPSWKAGFLKQQQYQNFGCVTLSLIISNHPPYITPKPPTNTFLYHPAYIIPPTVLHHLYLDPGPNLGPGICGVQRPDGCAGLPPVPCCCFGGNPKKMGGMALLKFGGDLVSQLWIFYF